MTIPLSSAKLDERWPVRCSQRPNRKRIDFAFYRRQRTEPVPTFGKWPCMHGFQTSHIDRISAGTLARRGMRGGSSCALHYATIPTYFLVTLRMEVSKGLLWLFENEGRGGSDDDHG